LGKQLKHEEPENKNPHCLYPCLLLDLMKPLVNPWSPLTQASHYMTTSRPAAAIQIDGNKSKPSQGPQGILRWMPLLPQPSLFLGLGTVITIQKLLNRLGTSSFSVSC